MRKLVGPALAALVMLATAAPTAAGPVEVARMAAAEPRFAGEQVVFPSLSGERMTIWRAAPGAERNVVHQEVARSGLPQLRASADRLAVLHDPSASPKLDVGPPTGPLTRLFECSGESGFRVVSTPGVASFDVDGTRLAYVAHPCPDGPGKTEVIVRDLALEGAPIVDRLDKSGSEYVWGIDLAGRHLAVYHSVSALQTASIEVHDLEANALRYHAGGGAFSLQPDGKLAVGVGADNGPCSLNWYSLTEPSPHPVAGACPRGSVKLSGDRVAYRARPAVDGPETLEVSALDGEPVVRAQTETRGALSEVDLDGSRIAYVAGACTGSEQSVIVDDLAGPPLTDRCPIRITGKPVEASESGTVRVRIACSQGCRGELDLRRGSRSVVKGTKAFGLEGGGELVALRLTATVRRVLRKRGTLAVTARAQVEKRGGGVSVEQRAVRLLAPAGSR